MEHPAISEFREIVGDDYVITDISVIVGYHATSDRAPATLMKKSGEPLQPSDLASAIVRPNTAEQISTILKVANRMLVPIRVRTTGTGIHGGSTPRRGEVVLDLTRMKEICVHEEDGYVEFGPAVRPIEANNSLEPLGCWFPVYPTSPKVSSIGGILSINTSGHSVDCLLGKPSDYVLGLQVVLPTGKIIETGTKTLRRPAGPDLTRFFVGTEGLFGIITKIHYRLVRRPAEQMGALVIFPSISDATRAVKQLLQERAPSPFYLEVMDDVFTNSTFRKAGIVTGQGSSILTAVGGDAPKEASWKLERILGICKLNHATEMKVIKTAGEWDKISGIREVTQKARRLMIYAGAVDPPLSRITQVYENSYRIKDKVKTFRDVDYFAMGHAGGPSLHPCFWIPTGLDDSTRWKLIQELRELTIDFALENASSWGEQGMFPNHARFWIQRYGGESYALLLALKRTFDPNNILNRGNLVELAANSE